MNNSAVLKLRRVSVVNESAVLNLRRVSRVNESVVPEREKPRCGAFAPPDEGCPLSPQHSANTLTRSQPNTSTHTHSMREQH